MTSDDAPRHSSWWIIPIAVVIGATAMFLAFAAPHWTKQPTLPSAITVRADAQAGAASHGKHHAHHGQPRHRPTRTPTPTVTVTIAPASPTVTVVTPQRRVVTATHEPDGHDDSGPGHRDN